MEKNLNEQMAIDYLLGKLPEEDRKRFDDLSLMDDEFTDLLELVENELIDQYVRGELTGDTLKCFSSHYLASPIRREKVEFAEEFLRTLDMPPNEESTIKIAVVQPRWFRSSVTSHPWLKWGSAVVAIFLLVVAVYLIFENIDLKNQISQAQAEQSRLKIRKQELQQQLAQKGSSDREKSNELAFLRERLKQLEQQLNGNDQRAPKLIAFNLSPQMRGITDIPRFFIPQGTDSITFDLDLSTNDFSMYRLTLHNPATDEALWESDKLTANQNNTVKIMLPANLLKTQNYTFELFGISANDVEESIRDYPFRILNQ